LREVDVVVVGAVLRQAGDEHLELDHAQRRVVEHDPAEEMSAASARTGAPDRFAS
jgi:hypothetical protein